MRRPSPLAPTPRPQTGAPAENDTPQKDTPDKNTAQTDTVRTDTAQNASEQNASAGNDHPFVTPFPSRNAGRAGAREGADGSGSIPPRGARGGATDAESAVGLRDVWRAARERRRALRAEAKRFTAAQRRRRRIWITAAAALVVLVGGSLAAAYSPLFAVRTIDVAGTHTLKAGTVAQALSGQLGKPYPLVDESGIKAALVRFPMVESYSVQAVPPHDLVVRIVERTPVGAVKTAAGYTVVDAAGVALSTTPTAPAHVALITVNGGLDSASFQAIGSVMRALPASIRTKVTAVSAKSPAAVVLTLGKTGTKVVWGSADEMAKKVTSLRAIMKARPASGVSAYDVSAPGAVVVR